MAYTHAFALTVLEAEYLPRRNILSKGLASRARWRIGEYLLSPMERKSYADRRIRRPFFFLRRVERKDAREVLPESVERANRKYRCRGRKGRIVRRLRFP